MVLRRKVLVTEFLTSIRPQRWGESWPTITILIVWNLLKYQGT